MDDEQRLLETPSTQNGSSETGDAKIFQRKDHLMPSLASSVPTSMQRRYLFLGIPLVLSCCIYFATRSTTIERAAPTLIKAFIGFRHGSRGPTYTYEADIYKNSIENFIPEGRDKLTKLGKQEAYALGKRLRARYDDFLGPLYRSEEVKVYTTLVERTIMSGQLAMASLFPPNGYQVWDEELKWQPIPMYPDYIFNTSVGSSCPRFAMEAYKNIHIAFNKLNPADKKAVMHVKEYAGEPNARPYEVFARVWDTIYFQDKANLPIPEWIKDVFPDKMSNAAVELLKGFLTGSEVQRQLLLWNYAHALREFFNSKDERKMEIHSWHDLNNFALLIMLGVKVDVYPEPTSCIAIELHERRDQKYFEAYYYDSYKSKQPRQLEMGCGMSCSLEELNKIAEQFHVSNYKALCQTVNVTDINSLPKLKVIL